MAEIPVARKSGVPWWVWPLLALVIVGLLLWLFAGDDDVDVAAVPTEQMELAQVGPITDLTTLLAAEEETLVGREVRLDDVLVQSVTGDRTFYVGPSANERVFIVLNQVPTPETPGVEGRYDVTEGQRVDINGVVRGMDDPMLRSEGLEGVPAGAGAVVYAQSLNINPT